jgi:hypothetical protein
VKLRTTFLLWVLCLSLGTVTGQNIFKQSYDVPGDNFTKGIHTNTLDGGMILISRAANINGSRYFTIFKTFSNGDVQWSQRFEQPGNCNVSNIVQLPDSSYFFCFVELNYPEKYYITHLDKNGALIYCRSLTPPPDFIVAFDPYCIVKSNGHVYVQADLHNMTNGMSGWHLFEVDANGNVVFSTCYNGSTLKCLGRNFTQCSNGDLLLVGYQRDTVSLEFGPVITRVDSDGVLLWSKLYLDTSTSIAGLAVTEMSNGNIVVTASHTTPGNEVIRLETDAGGNLLRSREYGNTASSLSPYTAMRAEHNSLIIFGTTDTGSFAMKLDSLGNVMHARKLHWIVPNRIQLYGQQAYSFSGVDSQLNRAVIFTTDSTLTACFGSVMSMDTGTVHFQTLPIVSVYNVPLYDSAFALNDTLWPGSNIKVCGPVGIEDPEAVSAMSVFPNPAHDAVRIHCEENISAVQLFDANGRILVEAKVNSTDYTLQILPHLPGLYLVRIQTEHSVKTIRLIVD